MPIIDYPFTTGNNLYSLPKPAVPLIIRNPANGFDFSTWALIDTGADSTAIPEFIAKKLYHDIRNHEVETDYHFGISGQTKIFFHSFEMDILNYNSKGEILTDVAVHIPRTKLAVVPELHTVILGVKDFLEKYVLTINYPETTFSLKRPSKKI